MTFKTRNTTTNSVIRFLFWPVQLLHQVSRCFFGVSHNANIFNKQEPISFLPRQMTSFVPHTRETY